MFSVGQRKVVPFANIIFAQYKTFTKIRWLVKSGLEILQRVSLPTKATYK